jgi:hypothetical protein
MIRLKQATVHKYKSIESDQAFDIESDVTVLVGIPKKRNKWTRRALSKAPSLVSMNLMMT